MVLLKAGDKAPDFTLATDSHPAVSLSDFRGKKVVLYFYPKDNTPGCTREACDLRDVFSAITASDAVILGISKDTPKRHQSFREKYQLPFELLSDENGDVCELYNIINKKSLFGKTIFGIQRSTFLINEKGIIEKIWRKVKVTGHAEAILEALKETGTMQP